MHLAAVVELLPSCDAVVLRRRDALPFVLVPCVADAAVLRGVVVLLLSRCVCGKGAAATTTLLCCCICLEFGCLVAGVRGNLPSPRPIPARHAPVF